MRKEIKIGLLAIVGIALLIWGYNFLKGQNLFKSQAKYYVKYENILKLQKSSPVYIHGYQVGNVSEIQIDPVDLQTIIVTLEVLPEINLPPDTKAVLYADGVMGDMAIELKYEANCDSDCLVSGDYLEGMALSFLGSFLQPEELDVYINRIKSGVGGIMDIVNEKMESETFQDSEIGQILNSFKNTVSNLESGSTRLNQMIQANTAAIGSVIENLNQLTGGLSDNQASIDSTIQNVAKITAALAGDNGIETTLLNTNKAISQLGDAGEKTKETLTGLNTVSENLNTTLTGINRGEGTLGRLVSQDDLYYELKSSIQNLDLLLQDFRLNPKRYVNVSVFGKKGKNYTLPENDPAYELKDSVPD